MAGNALINASFLDGVAGWAATDGAPTADETVRGGPGRIALVRTLARTTGQAVQLISDPVPCAAGADVEAHGLAAATAPLGLAVQFLTAGDVAIGAPVGLPLLRAGSGSAARGVASTFARFAGHLVAPPATAKARLVATATAAADGAVSLFLTRPYLAVDAPVLASGWRVWDPGPSSNPDLDLPTFPGDLPALLNDGYECAPIASRRSFSTDSGVPVFERINDGGWYSLTGAMRLTLLQHEALERFFASFALTNQSAFWFVIPDTGQLARVQWSDEGAPQIVERRGPTRLTRISLLAEIV